ncbi:MAG: 3-isopropylmalate dehydratase small subunit [Halioglobus sp.]
MDKLIRVKAVAAPLLRSNIDTDAISPGDRILKVKKSGFADALFANWRLQTSENGIDEANPEFILNQEPYDSAGILLAGPNFGCGSSRETAVWALRDWGIKVVIAPSFSGIFLANCFKNGLLPLVLPFEQIQEIAEQVFQSNGQGEVLVDLQHTFVESPLGTNYPFAISEYQRQILLQGLDPISAALLYSEQIDAFQSKDKVARPWIYKYPSVRRMPE